jgi:hypothetical protein
MARRTPHKGYFVKVEISCDSMGVCCVQAVSKKRARERICGMDYKIQWSDFNVTKRDQGEMSRGWPVRKLVPTGSWNDMVEAWGDTAEGGGGLFGKRRRRRRR